MSCIDRGRVVCNIQTLSQGRRQTPVQPPRPPGREGAATAIAIITHRRIAPMTKAHDKIAELAQARRQQPLEIDPERTALLVVDMQEYFLNPDSPYGAVLNGRVAGYTGDFMEQATTRVVPNLSRLVDAFRARGAPVAWSKLASGLPGGEDLSAPMKRLNQVARQQGLAAAIPWQGDRWAQFLPELSARDDELVIHKTTYGAFASTGLEALLKAQGLSLLVLGGVVTNVCVEATAREAVDRGFEVVIAGDACCAYSPEVHQASLFSFQATFGQVRSTEFLLERLVPAPAG